MLNGGLRRNPIDRLILNPDLETRRGNARRIFAAIGAISFTCAILVFVLFYTQSFLNPQCVKPSPLTRQSYTLRDWGRPERFRGWIDLQQQGVTNDYARYVGPNKKHPFVWLSVALAGSKEQYTDPGLYEEQSGIVRRTSVKAKQQLPDLDTLGLRDHFRGWVDVQNQGVANDYAYYVGPTADIPFPWLTVALAGSSQQRTHVHLYEEKYGVVRQRTVAEMRNEMAAVVSELASSILVNPNNQTQLVVLDSEEIHPND